LLSTGPQRTLRIPMPLVHECQEPGCSTLTMGARCLQHEQLARKRAIVRIGAFSKRFKAPAIGLAIAAAAAFAGRASRSA
jgi:hypothetical protein